MKPANEAAAVSPVSFGAIYFYNRPWFQLSMAHQRRKRAKTIDTSYASQGDFFRAKPEYMRKGYTKQVPAPPIHGEFAAIQHQAREAARQGRIEVDTMILLDVSSSMGWDHEGFDQPRHVGASTG